jgi:hypothetical protein
VAGLPGNPADQAVDVIGEYDANTTFASTALEFDLSRGATVLRSKVIFGFNPGTTVGQINALLQTLNATVVRTYDKTAVIEARIQDPGSLGALNTLLASLRSNPVVRFALPSALAPANALPAIHQGQLAPSLGRIAHHLAVRAAPAWNARRAVELGGVALGPVLLIADYFGGGDPAAGFLDTAYIGSVGTGFTNTLRPDAHGYHVLGIAAASFNSLQDQADSSLISGLYAGSKPVLLEIDDLSLAGSQCTAPVPQLLFNACLGKSIEDRLRSMLRAYALVDRKLVLNTSLGWNGNGGISEIEAEGLKLYWLSLVRGNFGNTPSPLEEKFFHSAAAGNDPTLPARRNIGWTRAAIDGVMNNTAVVENRSASSQAPFTAAGIHSSSSMGGNLSAIGSNTNAQPVDQGVWSYGDAAGAPIDRAPCRRDPSKVCPFLGTSMAAPQVAGLAASFWAIRSDLTSSELLKLIRSHATPVAGGGEPLIDAYASLLAADKPAALLGAMGNPLAAPARLAVLDVDENNRFDLTDALYFVDTFDTSKGASAYDTSSATWIAVGSKQVDRSRFDLNGDGLVGGSNTARFNLDINYDAATWSSIYNSASYEPAPGLSVQLDEQSTTDLQVLCYYVYSKLWRGTDADRGTLVSHMASKSPAMSCTSYIVELKINDTSQNWSGLPATIRLSSLYNVSPAQFRANGNSGTCGNQGEPLGERGSTLFSQTVDADAAFLGARTVTGMPSPISGGAINRNNCSSFFAWKSVDVNGNKLTKAWINATGRAVFGFGGTVVSDWEYQVRYYSGDPLLNYSDRKVQMGVVPGSGFFASSFEPVSYSVQFIPAPP